MCVPDSKPKLAENGCGHFAVVYHICMLTHNRHHSGGWNRSRLTKVLHTELNWFSLIGHSSNCTGPTPANSLMSASSQRQGFQHVQYT